MAHFRGIPTALRERFGVPVVFYDGDVPMSLPRVRRHGHGLQLLPRRRSGRVRPRRLELGGRARRACSSSARAAPRPSSGAPTPTSSRRSRSRRRRTSSSTATATSSGATGWRRSSASRRASCPTSTSRSAAATSRATSGARALIGDVPFNVFPRAISAARVNLCITRRSHATVYASSLLPAVRARGGGRGDRRESVQRDRALVRARQRAARRQRRGRGGRRPTATCSTIRRRPRRWGAARASACSTSTPTGTARGGCSSCVGLRVAAHVD